MFGQTNNYAAGENISLYNLYGEKPAIIIKKMYIKPIVKKMQETTVRFHLTPVRMTIIKTINTGEDVEKREPSNIVGGNVNW